MARLVPLRASTSTNLTGSISTNLTGSILKKTLLVVVCLLALAWVQTAVAQAQAQAPHAGGSPGGAGHVGGGARMSAPPPQAAISRPRVFGGLRVPGSRGAGLRGAGLRGAGPSAGPRAAGVSLRGFGFRQGPIGVFRRPVFFGARFFRFGAGLGFNSMWWPTCGPSLGWALGWGYDCYPVPFYGYGLGNYVPQQTYENTVYVYVPEERDLVWLYLKDGTVYEVTDYWFVNGEVHFSMIEDDPRKPAEHTVPYKELDVEKTIYVNSHRGFRIVFRDEPWQQYLKDHPDLTPPDVPPSDLESPQEN